MIKRKNLTVILLVFVVTATVVFVPMYINVFSSNSLTDKIEYWEYSGNNSNTITCKQVAELYYKNQLNGGTYSDILIDGKNTELYNIKNEVCTLLENVFIENEELLIKLKNSTAGKILNCTKQSILTVLNSNPVVLNLISFCCWNGNETIEVIYDEKTFTLIEISYESADLSAYNAEIITKQISDYYENLGLNEYQYFCNSDIQNISCFILNSAETAIEQN